MKRLAIIMALLGLILSACGGGGGSDSDSTPSITTLSGTAAAGAAIIGQVTIKDSSTPVKTASTTIEADGNYTVDVTGMTPPFMLRAEGSVGGRTYKLHSYAEDADLGGTVNITPFTDLIVANAAGQLAATLFDNDDFSGLTAEEVATQEAALQDKLQNVLTSLGVDTAIDLLHTAFSADHTALDAALDMVRVSVDPATDVATITNLIDNTSITDDITVSTDNSDVLTVSSDLTVVLTNQQAIYNTFDNFSALFANGLPSSSQLSPFFATDFLLADQSKDQFITELTTDPSLVGLSFSHVVIDALDETAGTATVTFNVVFNGKVSFEPETWYLAKNVDTWEMRGNQEIVDRSFDFQCNYYTSSKGTPTYGCGMTLDVRDNDFTNNGTAGAPIASAKVTVIHNGQAVPNSEIYLGVPDWGTAGELYVLDGDYSDDYILFGSGADQFDPTLIQAGDSLRFDLYTEDLDTTTPAVSGTPVATYYTPVLADPVTDATGVSYPNATQATLDAFYALTEAGGDLPVSWTVPTGQYSSEITLIFCDGSNCVDVWADMPSSSGTTLTIDTSSLNAANAPYYTELRLYTLDAQGHEFLHTYQGNTADSAPTVTGFTAAMLDTHPTFYLTYQGNPDETLTTGFTQEEIVVVSGSAGSYQVEYTDTYYDANNNYVSSVTNNVQLTLNQDGTLTAAVTGDPTPTIFTLTGSTDSYLTVSATYGTDTWTDDWYLSPPAGWLTSTTPPTSSFTATMLDAHPTFYLTYQGNQDGTLTTGFTQEEIVVVSGSAGSYQVEVTDTYYDDNNTYVSYGSFSVELTLNQDGTLTAVVTGDPTPTYFTLTGSTDSYLTVSGTYGTDTWTDDWYLSPPAGWIVK